MPVDRINFYENQNEASMRLRRTVVLYDNEPYYVIGVTDHINDGKLRIYLDKMGFEGLSYDRLTNAPNCHDWHQNELGPRLDAWIEANPDKGIYRKYLGAAGFNKFRPFPLGNINIDGHVTYCERTPTRNTFQGLRTEALINQLVSVAPNKQPTGKKRFHNCSTYAMGNTCPVDMFQGYFYSCIMGIYPSFHEVMNALNDPDVINTGAAFHREFSVHRGPLNMRFLCYKTEGIGIIVTSTPNSNLYGLKLSKDFEYLKEMIEELNVFNYIMVQE